MVWKALVKTGLMGTDRSQLTPNVLEQLQKFGISTNQDPAKILLEGASIHSLMRKSGAQFEIYNNQLPVIDNADVDSFCSIESTAHLKIILSGKYREALGEFIRTLVDSGKTIPPEMLPNLLEEAKDSNDWWEEIEPCIGTRGQWLIEQNPVWHFLIQHVEISDWETGSEKERLNLLRKMRSINPQRGIELLESSWKTEGIATKKKFIQTLENGLSKSDEPFLEKCLEESRKENRRFAARLLARIPESGLVDRMLNRLQPLIHLKKRVVKKTSLKIILPDSFDESMIRDSIDPSAQWYQGGLKASRLGQMITLVPITKLETLLGLKGIALLNAVVRSEYAELLFQAMIESCTLHRDNQWAILLLQFWIENYDKQRWQNLKGQDLLSLLNEDQFDQIAFKYLTIETGLPEENTPLDLILKTLDLNWTDRLGNLYIKKMQEWMLSDHARYWGGLHIRRTLKKAAFKVNADLYGTLSKGWPEDSTIWAGWEEDVEQFLATLRFRKVMIETMKL